MIEKFESLFGAYLIHAWGMSETSPLASIGTLLDKHQDLPLQQRSTSVAPGRPAASSPAIGVVSAMIWLKRVAISSSAVSQPTC